MREHPACKWRSDSLHRTEGASRRTLSVLGVGRRCAIGETVTADEIEKSYQEVCFGYDEPDIMWLLGKTLKEFLRQVGDARTVTDDGHPIVDSEMYVMTRKGIFLVEDDAT